jgi:hypothetical protein
MPEANLPDTPLHVGAEEWLNRGASREKIAARYEARQRREASPPVATQAVPLPTVRWPPPPEKAYLTACEALTWIGWGLVLKAERAAELETELIEKWGVSRHGFSGLLESLAAENERAREVRSRIERREGQSIELAELARRLEVDHSTLSHSYDLLELASAALVKACVDGQVKAVGQCGYGRNANDTISAKVFDQSGVEITWWDTIESDALPSWRRVRFRQSDILRLWPAQPSANSPPEPQIIVRVDGDSGASPSDDPVELVIGEQKAQPPSGTLPWAVFRIMEQLAYPPDRAWNLLHKAMCASELTPRKGNLWDPGQGPKLEQWERDDLDFDFRRYQDDARSGRPLGSLRIVGRGFHPHEITIPVEEFEHWLASQISARVANRTTEPLPPPTQAEATPSGFLHIDAAVDSVQQRLGWSQGRASTALLDAFISGEIATRRRKPARHPAGPHEHFDRENWRGARLDVEAFRRQQSGGVVVLGHEHHLHRFLVHAADFDAWLRRQAGGSGAQEVGLTAPGPRDVRQTDHPGTDAPLIDKLPGWFSEWAAKHPEHSEAETAEAAKKKFPGERITRQMIRDLLKPPDGNPRRRGRKPGKSYAEHALRMRS